jgi:hypothetical protein
MMIECTVIDFLLVIDHKCTHLLNYDYFMHCYATALSFVTGCIYEWLCSINCQYVSTNYTTGSFERVFNKRAAKAMCAAITAK